MTSPGGERVSPRAALAARGFRIAPQQKSPMFLSSIFLPQKIPFTTFPFFGFSAFKNTFE
jgi:hypothetical protein